MKEIRKYRSSGGKVPFDDWMKSLRDRRAKMRIRIRVDRLTLGLEGD